MAGHVHLIKLSVGSESVGSLARWQRRRAAEQAAGRPRHVTRMWPRRGEEVLAGGSIFWVIKGVVLARQRIVALEEVRGEDGILRCGIVLDPALVRTEAVPRRPFQGWRYLDPADAPRDLGGARRGDAELPPRLEAALAEIGVR